MAFKETLSNKKIHTIAVKRMNTLFEKSKGLIGEKKPTALFLKTRFGIHTFGVQFPIDILILDTTYQVIKLKQSLQPNSFFFWNPRYCFVVELPSNSIQSLEIKKHDLVEIYDL